MVKNILIILTIMALLLVSLFYPEIPLVGNWAFMSFLIVLLMLGTMFGELERQEVNAKEIALISTIATLGAVCRIPFISLMSIQPTIFIAMITGYVFGYRKGFLVGAVSVMVSSFFASHGSWTPWQMLCVGLAGGSGDWLKRMQKEFHLVTFAIFCCVWGYFYGWIMTYWYWVTFVFPLNVESFIKCYLSAIAYDTTRAVGNLFFALIFGNTFYSILMRFRKKLHVEFFIAEIKEKN